MSAVLSVDNEEARFVEDESVSVSLEFPWDAAEEHRCTACGVLLTDTVDGYVDSSGDTTCAGSASEEESGIGPHVPERLPLSWINSAAILVDNDADSVTLSISVGDPRGAFCFTVRRVPDDAPDPFAGRLVLHVPYPGEFMPHRPLTALHPGSCLIG